MKKKIKVSKASPENRCKVLLVSFDETSGDIPVMLVGTKDGNTVEIINAFKGDEARGIYDKLTKPQTKE